MRSTASFKGHPIHVMLIPFPIAFLGGSFVFDLAGFLSDSPALWTTGGHLVIAGIVMALVAAVPGAVDYVTTVPPDSSGKERATRHALANLSAVTLFAISWLVRGAPADSPSLATLGIAAVGVALLTVGGWMGGTLAYRNQIGVDHRYAGAGKWNEERVGGEDDPLVATTSELEVDQMKLLHVNGRRIVLARTEDGFVAFDDRCPHRGGSIAGGSMICGTVQCPWHGSQFDVTRGGSLEAGPAESGICTYETRVEGDGIRLVL